MKFTKDIIFIDLETTGFKPVLHEITEVGIVKLDGMTLEVIEEYNPLVKIEGTVPNKIVELTGITDQMLADDGVEFEVVKREVQRLAEDSIVVAHNAPFDFSFLKWHFDIDPKFFYDTLTLSRVITPEHSKHALGDICGRIGYDLTNAHRAIHDVHATIEVFKHLMGLKDSAHKDYINTLHAGRGLRFKPQFTKQIIK